MRARFNQLLNSYHGTSTSHYLRLPGYKYYYYQQSGKDEVVFGYQMKGNKCFVLGDPIGNPQLIRPAITEFMKKADCLGYQLAFYKISDKYVVMLHEAGFHFTKVGEAGIADITTEEMPWVNQQLEHQRLAKEGYHFTWYEHLPEELFVAVSDVSKRWLHCAREKHFSVGRFNEAYLLDSGVGIVRKEQKIVGFITGKSISEHQAGYDLLRVLPGEPVELADYLLVNLFIVYQEKGYVEANLGLAPLANVGETDFSFFQERIMHIVYNYGNFFYSFQSAYEDKLRYVTRWEGRYFAYMKGSSFIVATLQLFILIGKGKEKSISFTEEILTEL